MDVDEEIINLYNCGYSLDTITNVVFNCYGSCPPKNFSFSSFIIDEKRKFSRLDCLVYVSRVIFNYNCKK